MHQASCRPLMFSAKRGSYGHVIRPESWHFAFRQAMRFVQNEVLNVRHRHTWFS